MSDEKLKFVWSVSFKLLRLCGEAKWLWTVSPMWERLFMKSTSTGLLSEKIERELEFNPNMY